MTCFSLPFRRNVGENLNGNCRFDFGANYSCPIISVGKIISMLEHDYKFEDLATKVNRSDLKVLCNSVLIGCSVRVTD